jgi:hypothetical protein
VHLFGAQPEKLIGELPPRNAARRSGTMAATTLTKRVDLLKAAMARI